MSKWESIFSPLLHTRCNSISAREKQINVLSLLEGERRKISRTWALDDCERAHCWYFDATPHSVRLQMKVKINCSPQDAICSIHGPWSFALYAASCMRRYVYTSKRPWHLNYVSWPIRFLFRSYHAYLFFFRNFQDWWKISFSSTNSSNLCSSSFDLKYLIGILRQFVQLYRQLSIICVWLQKIYNYIVLYILHFERRYLYIVAICYNTYALINWL